MSETSASIVYPMKRVFSALVLFVSVGFSTPLFAVLTPGGGLTLLSTWTDLGHLSSTQTLSLDLVTAQVADIEIRVVNVNTNEVVAQIGKIWYYDTQTPSIANGGGNYPVIVTVGPSGGQDIVNITHLPDGDYRVELDMLFPDYWGSYLFVWHQPTAYFDPYSGYGALYLDVGANQSDVWSWGGAGLIVY